MLRRKIIRRCSGGGLPQEAFPRIRDGSGHSVPRGAGGAKTSLAHEAIRESKLGHRLKLSLAEAAVDWSPAGACKVWIASAALGALGGLAARSAAVSLIGLALGAVAPPLLLLALRKRCERRLLDSLPDFLERVAHGFRADVSTLAALAEAQREARSPLREEMGEVLAGVSAGRPLPSVLERWRVRRSHPDVNLAVAALSIGAAGGRRAQAIDGVAATLRAGRNSLGELSTLSLQGRASALIIVLLPLGFLGLDSLIGGDTLRYLLSSSLGLICLGLGLGLDAIAFIWMYRITRSA